MSSPASRAALHAPVENAAAGPAGVASSAGFTQNLGMGGSRRQHLGQRCRSPFCFSLLCSSLLCSSLLAALVGCADASSSAAPPTESGPVVAPAESAGSSSASPAAVGMPPAGVSAAVGTSEGNPTPSLESPAANAQPDVPSSYVPVPITPPVSDTDSPLPVAREDGYTTEPNIVYGPLPEQRLDILYPPTAGPNGTDKLPGVILFHGDGEGESDKAAMASFYSRFLAHGFVVATAEYRGASQSVAPAAVQDALIATKWFYDHLADYNVDPSKYVVAGAGAGGHLALMVGMVTAAANLGPVHPTEFQIAAIVNGYGPADIADLSSSGAAFAEAWLPASTPNRAALVSQMSPITYVRSGLPPLLTIQGANDTTVPVAEGQNLYALLKAVGTDAEHHLVPGARHSFETPRTSWPDAEKTIFNFLVARGIGK